MLRLDSPCWAMILVQNMTLKVTRDLRKDIEINSKALAYFYYYMEVCF